MLPQKLGLDVVDETDTGNLVTLEVNGENSGYQGLAALGEDLSERILHILGNSLAGQKILVNSSNFHEFIMSSANAEVMKQIRDSYGLSFTFSPLLSGQLTTNEFEAATGYSLSNFGGIMGLGMFLRDSTLHKHMINSPSLEYITNDKFLQYELLKDIPRLNMPESWFLDELASYSKIVELQQRYGKLIQKPRFGKQGQDIVVLTEETIEGVRDMTLEEWDQDSNNNSIVERVSYAVNYGMWESTDDYAAGYRFDPKTEDIDLVASKLEENPILFASYIGDFYNRDPNKAIEITKKRLNEYGVLVQRFVETQPIINDNTGQPHYARARLLWFGEYLGGYWALSKEPISSDDHFNPIVNYSTTKIAQRFTPEEGERFKDYAQTVVPNILEKVTHFKVLDNFEEDMLKKNFLSLINQQITY